MVIVANLLPLTLAATSAPSDEMREEERAFFGF